MNNLTTVFMTSSDDESGYIKATVRRRNVTAMLEMGWSRTWEPEEVEAPIAYVDDGDQGSGIPGSREWHALELAHIDTKEGVEEYVLSVNGQNIDKRGSLEKVKEKALDILVGDNGDG